MAYVVFVFGCSAPKESTQGPPMMQSGSSPQPTPPTPIYYQPSDATAAVPHPVAQDGDIDFYDSAGRAVAYVDANQDLTIYLWSGKPCAYLDGEDIYGFNGKHLGWFHSGVLYDHDGYVVAGVAQAFMSPVQLAPLKGLKQLCPLKSLKELSPLKPLFSREWSQTPAQIFFLSGASD